MIDARFVPIDKWPGEKRKYYSRPDAPFRVTYDKTLTLLERELRHLRATRIVIQGYFRADQIRNDGWPRSSARPSEPGVILGFSGKSGDLSYPCDTYKKYEDNIRAIALSLEALRTVDRYGVTRNNEQYKGWAKLPPAPEVMKYEDAVHFIALHSGIIPSTQDRLKDAFRAAARKLHPDSSDGNHGQFIMLGNAKEVIEKAEGWVS